MKTDNILMNARVYCGTYGKYNSGSIAGKWFALADYGDYDEFMNACRELHADERDPEYMFQDCEHMAFIRHSEPTCDDIRRWYDMREDVEGLSEEEADAVLAYWEEVDRGREVSEILEDYEGRWDSQEEYAEYIFNECDRIPESLVNYIDWSAVARDVFLDYYYCEGGHVFRA